MCVACITLGLVDKSAGFKPRQHAKAPNASRKKAPVFPGPFCISIWLVSGEAAAGMSQRGVNLAAI